MDQKNTSQLASGGTLPEITSLLSAHGTGIWLYDHASERLDFVNDLPAILGFDQSGITYGDMAGMRSFIHPDDLPRFNEAFDQTLERAGNKTSVEYRMTGSNGEELWIKERMYSFAGGEKGMKVVSCSSRAGRERLLEEEVASLETRYRKLVNTLPDFIFVFDKDFVFNDIIMPDSMSLLHPREELIGSCARKIFSPEVSDLYVSNIRECLRTGQMKEIEYFLDMFGIRYYFQARIVPFENGLVFALIRDIGDRVRRMEELLEARKKAEDADRMKSAFLANMSHEIRTPLNAIVGFTEVIASEDDPVLRAEYMEIVRTNNELLLQLINDILDLSRIESGKCEINFKETDIHILIDEVDKIQRLKMKPGVDFLTECPDTEIHVLTDHKRVTQVLFNFLSNAVKNTRTGSITLRVELIDNHIKFSVIDTGCGIAADRLKTIFNRFEKVNDFVQGTGLGLAISQSLVERLGGEIGVESELGTGSTFWFTLPYSDTQSGGNTECNATNAPQPKRILVVESSDESYRFIENTLTKAYVDVGILHAHNGEEAVNSFILDKPSLIIINTHMPAVNLSSIEAIKKIRAISSVVPIIAITSSSFYMERQWALESGANDIIPEPFSSTKLREAVLAFL